MCKKKTMPLKFIFTVVIFLIATSCSLFSLVGSGKPEIYYGMRSEDGNGIMDCSGEWVLEPVKKGPILSGLMVDGLAPTMSFEYDGYIYINQKGEPAFEDIYLFAFPFSEGLAAVETEDGIGFIDTSGAFVIEPQYGRAMGFSGNFSDGLLNVPMDVNEMSIAKSWIYIDKAGSEVLGPYEFASSFSNGYASVTEGRGEERKTGFIDTEGKFVLEFSMDEPFRPAGGYSEGLFPVRDIDLQMSEGTCSIGFMDIDKNWVIEPMYCDVGRFSDGLAYVSMVQPQPFGEYGYIDTLGEMVIQAEYEFASEFSGGCARVTWNNLNGFALINNKGEILYKYETEK